MSENNTIKIYGARVHNLKNVDVEIPRDSLTVITGLSGSGKSSLAFDTIYAEGQRRYLETLSTYARQFVGTMEAARCGQDRRAGLSPVISIEQKTTNKNPRSTVGTVTEINDFLRLLFARASDAYSPVTGEKMVHHTDDQIGDLILRNFDGRKIALLTPLVCGRKGHYRELFEGLAKKGYLYARVDGEIREIFAGLRLDRYKIHYVELVVDRLVVKPDVRSRLLKSLQEAMRQGKGTMMVYDYDDDNVRFYSRHLMCPTSGIAFNEPAPHSFSFNSPQGACPHCNGLGEEAVFDMERIVPDGGKSIRDGGVEPLGRYRNNLLFAELEALGRKYDFTIDDPIESLNEEALNAVSVRRQRTVANRCARIGRYGQLHGFVGRRSGLYREAARRFCVQQRGQMEGTIRRPARMQRLRRQPATQGSALFQNRRKKHRRIVGAQYRGIRPLDGRHRKTPFEKTGADRTRNSERDPRTTCVFCWTSDWATCR